MRDFEGYRFIALASLLGEWIVLHPRNDVVIPDEWKATNLEALRSYTPALEHLAMDASQSSLEKLIALIQQPGVKFTDLGPLSEELKGRIQDQVQKRIIFGLNQRESSFANLPRAGWETAIARFPDIGYNVDEAAFCLALARYPASVYHSVQITESGLVELGKFLRVNDPHSGWTAVANALENVVSKSHKDRTPFERKHFASLEQIHGTVQALKNAWRNKISHVQGRLILLKADFGFERAEEILTATRAFMRRLAEDLPPPKQKKARLSEINETDPTYVDPRDVAGMPPEERTSPRRKRSTPAKVTARRRPVSKKSG